MHRKLFERPHRLEPHPLDERAASLGLAMNRFNGEMADRLCTQRVQEHPPTGLHIGLRATPRLLLNGLIVDVSFGLESLEAAVRRALQLP
jgi:protein-disulfide isomerase